MYRYSVDQAVIYTSEDISLFRESPFACWMERLTLENPAHGIEADDGSVPPENIHVADEGLEKTLAGEGKNVVAIERDSNEAMRRTATLAAMRHGVDFIVDAQLAVGPLSDSASLLMRTSGYSELGNYLYFPCDTGSGAILSTTFRLCFLADLLHSLQGQLPPQMLVLQSSAGVTSIQTDNHIHHYRAVKQRFMAAQSSFRKHRMPDPVEAAHFGRWSDCANNLLKQRALGHREMAQLPVEDEPMETEPVAPAARKLSPAPGAAYDLDAVGGVPAQHTYVATSQAGTLAEQARLLTPNSGLSYSSATGSDSLENLEFIGSSQNPPMIGDGPHASPGAQGKDFREAPPANLRNPANVDMDVIQNLETGTEKVISTPFNDSLITNRDA